MSAFKKSAADLAELKKQCENLVTFQNAADPGAVALFQTIAKDVTALYPSFQKMRKKAAEKDPDKMMYGPAMLEKVRELLDDWENVYTTWEDVLKPMYEGAANEAAAAARRAAAQQSQLAQQQAEQELAQRREGFSERERERIEEEEMKKRKLLEQEERERQKQLEAQRAKEMREAALDAEEERLGAMSSDELIEQSLPDLVGLTLEALRKAVFGLRSLVQQVHQYPQAAEFRTIRFSNDVFQENVAAFPGAVMLLRAVGFRLVKFPLLPDNIASVAVEANAKRGDAKLSSLENERYLVLAEPGTDGAEWSAWIKLLGGAHRFLDEWHTTLDNRCREVGRTKMGSTPSSSVCAPQHLLALWHHHLERS